MGTQSDSSSQIGHGGTGATCAWCRKDFASVGELLDHADNLHESVA
jgi:hypothetical protein